MKMTKYILASILGLLVMTSCGEDFFDVKYTERLDANTAAELAATNPDALDGYLVGVFSYMVEYNGYHDEFGYMSVHHAMDMAGEDIVMSAAHWFSYDYEHDNHEYNYRRTSRNWLCFYTILAKANEILDFFPEKPEAADSKGVMGQAYVFRAMAYYYLIQLYQHPVTADGSVNWDAPGVPLYFAAPDNIPLEEQDNYKGRNTLRMVYEQIESDLLNAVELLEAGYVRPAKIYVDASVANGFLARYYLLSQNWAGAEAAAKKAYQGYTIGGPNATGIYDGFVDIENADWMWGFDHSTETQTTYASFFSHISDIAPGYAGLAYAARAIDVRLWSQIPDTDYRKAWFSDADGDPTRSSAGARIPYATFKFGHKSDWSEDYMYMRSAEMHLIEAEALAHQGNGTAAANALATLMAKRDPAWNASSVTVEDIFLQRRIELWGEGIVTYDRKRLNLGIDRSYEGNNHLVGYQKVIPARNKTWIYQIPRSEMQENKFITDAEQNE